MPPKIKNIADKILPVLRKHGVRKAGVFGSVVCGEATEESDVDVLVELPPNLSLFDFIGIKLELEDVLGKKVDLVEYASIKPRIRERILNQAVSIL